MGGRNSGYYMGPLEALGGAALSAFVPGGAAIGVPMMTSGLGTTIGQAAGGQKGSQIGGLLGGLAGGVGEAGFGLGGMGPLSSQLGPGGTWRTALSSSPVGKMLGGGAGDAAGGGSTWSGTIATPTDTASPSKLFQQGFSDQASGKGPLPSLQTQNIGPSAPTTDQPSFASRHPYLSQIGTSVANRALDGGSGGQSQPQPPPPGRTMPSSGQGATPFAPPIVQQVPQSNAPRPAPGPTYMGGVTSGGGNIPTMAQLQQLLQRAGGAFAPSQWFQNPPQMGSMGWGNPGNQG